MRRFLIASFTATLLIAGSGLPPRPSESDYAAHQSSDSATLGVSVVKPDQVKRMFSSDVAKRWVVVEAGLYPRDANGVNVDYFDFSLKIGDDLIRPGTPLEVAMSWPEKNSRYPSNGPRVVGETGVIYSSARDPITGRNRGVSTYEGVGVESGDPRGSAAPPPPPSGPDPAVIEAKARDRALPPGQTGRAVAGYLYFPIPPKKVKGAALELIYTRDATSMRLALPSN